MKESLFKKISNRVEHILINKGWVLIKTMRLIGRKRNLDLTYKAWDFVRFSSLELCAHEINTKNIPGAVAEVGVFQGAYAQKINEAFPERTLYLFDTFEGFHKEDMKVDVKEGYSTSTQDFSDTTEKFVLDRMKTPGKCIIKKGYFPDTAVDVADAFVFVSLDADMYKPIYDGLRFFYPKLARGGYIFIHDFNNHFYTGARQAVENFCEEEGIGFFPLSDIGGSVIISK